MKTIKIIILSIAIIMLSFESKAQFDSEKLNSKHSVGFALGATTGFGIAYKYSSNRWDVQLAFAPYKNEEEYLVSTGLTFMYTFVDSEKHDFFIYQGNHYLVLGETSRTLPYPTTGYKEEYLNHGLGFGVEFDFSNNFSMSFMTGYGAFDNFEIISMTGEINMYFNF